ncbi:tubulin-specific chaperone C [Lepeophtheirus salmonis]|uniref:tubulin-specific chaperone C n=1 Tax=Lepeophtheirus salmonis TaxID=72036 RepID=UPI001AE54712|nr:tubulin-specific chaperone C-like [Lepeophtheirus salmonis]
MSTSAPQVQQQLQALLSSLREELAHSPVELDHLNTLSLNIKEFERLFSEKASYLPSYDVKKLQASILGVKDQYQTLYQASQPKKRFAFRSRVAIKTREEIDALRSKQFGEVKTETGIGTHVQATFNDKVGETLTIPPNEMDPLITNLNQCTVRLTQSVPSTLHMTDLKNCIIILGPVQTSVFIERCEDCTFYIFCQQLRMHNSTNCYVYLHVTSKGIVEGCNNVGFGPYAVKFPGLNELMDKSGLDRGLNHWDGIQDFNWLTPDQPSPNWFVIPEEKRKNVLE